MPKYSPERAPAKITKCPHCKWTGSARGLFSHVRLSHIGKEQSLKIRKENPYVIDKSRPKALGSSLEKPIETYEEVLQELIAKCVLLVFKEYTKMHDPLFSPFPTRRQ